MLNTLNNYWEHKGKVRHKSFKTGECYELEFIGLKNCLEIQKHFKKYPLLTHKLVYFMLWSNVLDMMLNKQHLIPSGLSEIIGIKAQFKKGLSPILKSYFPSYKECIRPSYNPNLKNINAEWLTGFINADGHFGLFISTEDSAKMRCEPQFNIVQLNSSRIVLEHITKFLGFGTVYPLIPDPLLRNNSSTIQFSNIKYINKLIDIFKDTKFYGAKALDYADFCKAIQIMNAKEHLHSEGLLKLRNIAKGLNKNRTYK